MAGQEFGLPGADQHQTDQSRLLSRHSEGKSQLKAILLNYCLRRKIYQTSHLRCVIQQYRVIHTNAATLTAPAFILKQQNVNELLP